MNTFRALATSFFSRGIGSIPLTSVASYSDTIRECLQIPKEMKFLHAVAFGFADNSAASYATRLGRDAIEKNVTFYE